MQTVQQMVTEFHTAMEQDIGDPVLKRCETLGFDGARALYSDEEAWSKADLVELRRDLINEEIEEFKEAPNLENLLKEAADLVYVLYGWAVTFGLDLDEAVRRVHASNMSKLVDGKPVKREDGKVLKGPNYAAPDLRDLVRI